MADNTDVFEITDFTNATPWESFVSGLENIVHQWGLDRTEDIYSNSHNARQHRKSEKLIYGNKTFTISFNIGREARSPSTSGSEAGGVATSGKGGGDQTGEEWTLAMEDMMDPRHDFPASAHHLSRWFGVQEFVIIATTRENDALISETQAKLVMSSVTIAAKNTGCSVPIFVQIQSPWRQMYIGVCEGGGVRTTFDVVHLRQTPPPYSHLSGLLEIFKSKLEVVGSIPPVQTSVRFTYSLRHWDVEDWSGGGALEDTGDPMSNSLPIGVTTDPIEELHLSTLWPHLTEEVVVDNSFHSDLTPLSAPTWTIRAKLTSSESSQAASRIGNFLKLSYCLDPIDQLIDDMREGGVDVGGVSSPSNALSRITESKFESRFKARRFLRSTIEAGMERLQSATSKKEAAQQEVPSSDELDSLLMYLFPDAQVEEAPNPSSKAFKPPHGKEGETDSLLNMKMSPRGSLVDKLAFLLCKITNKSPSAPLQSLSLVWREVVEELRYRWENGHIVPNISSGAPNFDTCLLHQKLQLLNNCIKSKLGALGSPEEDIPSSLPEGEANQAFITPNASFLSSSLSQSHPNENEEDGDSDISQQDGSHHGDSKRTENESGSDAGEEEEDEFFEAQEDFHGRSSSLLQKGEEMDVTSPHSQHSEMDTHMEESVPGGNHGNQASSSNLGAQVNVDSDHNVEMTKYPKTQTSLRQGTAHPYKDLLLIATGEPLFVPKTQELGPLTEDMIFEQEKLLSQLGTSEEAAKVRAKLQSGSLLSDMQAFKAANPGCLLEDFVRWYSPRDWMEGEEEEEQTPLPLGVTAGSNQSDIASSEIMVKSDIGDGDGGGDGWEDGGWDVVIDDFQDDQPPVSIPGEESANLSSSDSKDVLPSPQEGLEEDQEEKEPKSKKKCRAPGHLSLRMQQADSPWREAWATAAPVPVARQKPLFDATREAEKVLHHLSALSPSQLTLQLLPNLLEHVVRSMRERLDESFSGLSCVENLVTGLCRLLQSMHTISLECLPKLQECVKLLGQAEKLLAAADSLAAKLNRGLETKGIAVQPEMKEDIRQGVISILDHQDLVVTKSSASVISLSLHGLLAAEMAATQDIVSGSGGDKQASATNDFLSPIGREYLLRCAVRSPSQEAVPSPQRMFAVMTADQFRLAGAFSADTNAY